jgi:phospholipid transport system substrate-binding protein
LAAPRSAAADATIAFIRALDNQAVSVIRSDMQLTEKAVYFRQVIHQDFDLTGISRFVLGPYWRVASPAEPRQFRSPFVDRLVRFYGRQLAQSGDGDFVVIGGRTGPEGFIATSQIIRPQATPIVVDWQLGISHGLYKIRDVAIDGGRMALAQRSQTAEIIARGGRPAWYAARDDAATGFSGRRRASRDGSAALTLFQYSVITGVPGASEVFASVADQDDQIGALALARSRVYLKLDGGRYQLRKPLSWYQRADR